MKNLIAKMKGKPMTKGQKENLNHLRWCVKNGYITVQDARIKWYEWYGED